MLQLEHVTMDRDELVYERDQLKHEVAMLRETVTHNVEESAAAARASRSSLDSASKELPPADSMAGQFRAQTARIQELQSSIEAWFLRTPLHDIYASSCCPSLSYTICMYIPWMTA